MNIVELILARVAAARKARSQAAVLNAGVETWFTRCEMMMNKRHENEALVNFPDMVGYFGLGLLKSNATIAKLKTTYAAAVDTPFFMRPSANPELSAKERAAVQSTVARELTEYLMARGLTPQDIPAPAPEYVQKWLRENVNNARARTTEAAKRAAAVDAMYQSGVMRSQYVKGGWHAAMNTMFADLVTKPYAVMAFDYAPTRDYFWSGNTPSAKLSLAPTFRAVRPEDILFGTDSTTAQDGEGVTELRARSRQEVVEMLVVAEKNDKAGYFPGEIRRALENFEKKSLNWSNEPSIEILNGGKCDKWSASPSSRVRSYVHSGVFSGAELATVGITGIDGMVNVTCEVLGGFLIRAVMVDHPMGGRNYYSASYTRRNDSPYGVSPLMILRDRQLECNWLMYAKNRNAWHVSGPSVVFNAAYFAKPEDVSLAPFSQHWASPKNQNTGHNWGVQQVNVNPAFAGLHEEVRRTMVLADEEAGVPALFSGMSRGGVSQTTLGGAVLQKTQGELGVDGAVINLDLFVIQPLAAALHFDNLRYLEDARYKRGDVEIEGRGISGLRDREQQQRLLTGALPMLMQTTQAGLTPTPLLNDALRSYYEGVGLDTSSLGPTADVQSETLGSPQPPVDARTAPGAALGL